MRVRLTRVEPVTVLLAYLILLKFNANGERK